MKILIAGCGYLGTALGGRLTAAGHEVWGIRRSPEGLKLLEMFHIHPVRADLNVPKTLRNLPQVDQVVFCQAPANKNDSYRRTYMEGTRKLLAALKGERLQKILFISSTSVYAQKDGSWVDEKTKTGEKDKTDETARLNAEFLLEAEKAVAESGRPYAILRLAGLYGPRRHRLRPLREGKIKPVFSELYTNRIHLEDAVSAAQLLLQKEANGIFLGADDEPSTQKEFYSWICERLGLPLGASEEGKPPHGSNKRCSNAKLKKLGLTLRYPSYREGYAPLIAEEMA